MWLLVLDHQDQEALHKKKGGQRREEKHLQKGEKRKNREKGEGSGEGKGKGEWVRNKRRKERKRVRNLQQKREEMLLLYN